MHTYQRATAIHFATKHFLVVRDITDIINELNELQDDHYYHIKTIDDRDLYFTKGNIMYLEQGILEDNTVFRDMEFVKLNKIQY